MGKKDWLAKSWSLPLPVIYPSPPLATGSTVEHMERHTVSIRVPTVLRRVPSAVPLTVVGASEDVPFRTIIYTCFKRGSLFSA